MATGVRIKIFDTAFHTKMNVTHALFPVRIGRNPLNDVQLSKREVSDFHAVLVEQGGRLMLRDLGSRNGTVLQEGRAPAHELVDLARSSHQFQISTFRFEVELAEVDASSLAEQRSKRGLLTKAPQGMPRSVRPTRFEASVSGTVQELLDKEKQGAERVEPIVDPGLQQAFDGVRESMQALVHALGHRANNLSAEDRMRLLDWAREKQPVLDRDPAFKRLLRHSMPPGSVDPAERQRLLEYVAYQGLCELASHYVPDNEEFQRQDEVIRFLGKLRDVLDGFLSSFVPLRDGYETFRTEMDINRNRPRQRKMSQMDTIETVQSADSPGALASRLLDWRTDMPGARKAIEGVFADVMIHQVALLRGVVRGVESMIADISPSVIEKELEAKKKGVLSGMFRYRELWKLYVAKHGDLADGEKRLFGLVFGPEFAKAYEKMLGS